MPARSNLRAGSSNAAERVALDDVVDAIEATTGDVTAWNELLERFAGEHPRPARIVELRVFGGMLVEELARARRRREHREGGLAVRARSWLQQHLAEFDAPSAPGPGSRAIPNNTAFLGYQRKAQSAAMAPGYNPMGFVTSNGWWMTVGNWRRAATQPSGLGCVRARGTDSSPSRFDPRRRTNTRRSVSDSAARAACATRATSRRARGRARRRGR